MFVAYFEAMSQNFYREAKQELEGLSVRITES